MSKYIYLCFLLASSLLSAQDDLTEIAAAPKPKKIQNENSYKIVQSLAEQATDFTAPLLQLQFQNWYNHTVWDSHSSSNTFLIRPVIPLKKTKSFPPQLMRVTVKVVTTPKIPRHKTGLGDSQFFDLFMYEFPEWGRIGFGPMAVFPTATNQSKIGQGKWQLGPALAAVLLRAHRWQFGFLAQNPYAFLGNSDHRNAITLLLQPLIAVHFPHNWYLISNAEMTFQWRPKQVQIPINIGIGKVAKIKGQPINAFLQTEWVVYKSHAAFQPHFTVQAGFNFLFPEHKPAGLDRAGP